MLLRLCLILSLLLFSSAAKAEGIETYGNADLPISAGGVKAITVRGSGDEAGFVGIGTDKPTEKLEVDGNVLSSGIVAARGDVYVGNSNIAVCTSTNAGAIRWDGAAFVGCDGTKWAPLGGSTPPGSVMAFDLNTCPDGWSALDYMSGRTIVGVGQGNTKQNGTVGTRYNLRDWGGAEDHTLTSNEMPSHKHNVDYWIASWSDNGNGGLNALAVWNDGDWSGGIARYNNPNIFLGNTGGDQPHNNMMPYVALLFCRKN